MAQIDLGLPPVRNVLGSRTSKTVVVGLLAALTLIFGALRLDQLVIRQPAADVRFGPTINNLTWNPASGELTRTGGDPYAFLQIPADSLPLDELVLECSGTPSTGASFVYRSPYYLPHTIIDDRLAVEGKIDLVADSYHIRFELGGSKVVRLDLSDDLTTPIVVREVVFRTRFLVGANPTFRLFAASLIALLLAVAWICAGPLVKKYRGVEIAAVVLLVALKIWLSGDMRMSIYADARHDDALFLSQGHSIANGDWLGQFGELTLAKGPSYSLFIALVQLSRIPLLDAQALFHSLACVLFLLALQPLARSAGVRLLLLAVLLFDPHPLSSEAGERALRSSIQPALTLLTLAGVIGMGARVSRGNLPLLPWSILAGASLAVFWFSREEGIWIVPTLLVITGCSLWLTWRGADHSRRLSGSAILLLPFAAWFGALWTLRAVNHSYYGAWISVDAKDGGFPDAYGALTRLTPRVEISGVPVTKESRLKAYAVSPTFAELRPILEGQTGDTWAHHGWEQLADHPSAGKEIRGGWFGWALRQAALETGYYQDAQSTSNFWQRVADEINAACDDGRIAAGRKRSGFFPRWNSTYWTPLPAAVAGATAVVVRFSDYKAQAYPSRGDPQKIQSYARVIHESPVLEWLAPTFRTHLRLVIFSIYQTAGWACSIIALLCTILVAFKHRGAPRLMELTILIALLGGATALILLVALVDVTSFSALHAMYLAPATPLVLAAWTLAPNWAFSRHEIRTGETARSW